VDYDVTGEYVQKKELTIYLDQNANIRNLINRFIVLLSPIPVQK
jgi:hypothetical protein